MSAVREILSETLRGPRCPVCFRDDGAHNVICDVPGYIKAWKRIRSDQAQRAADAIWTDGRAAE